MTVRVDVAPSMLTWARERSGRDPRELASLFPALDDWEDGQAQPTLKQLEAYAAATYAPVGYLLLPAPPDEPLPVPDLRTMGDGPVQRPSPNLLDTIYLCSERQEWYRDHAISQRQDRVDVVDSLDLTTAPVAAACTISRRLRFDLEARGQFGTWSDAIAGLAGRLEDIGILVMISGVVGSNTHRKLDPDEFRGFALVDDLAPLIFINGSDTKAAQIFTLAHETAHVWLGGSAISSPSANEQPQGDIERWCNAVAAELLVPIDDLRQEFRPAAPRTAELDRLARRYKASTLVVLRRLFDAGQMSWGVFRVAYAAEAERVTGFARRSGGGDFYNTQPVRVSKRFARAVISDALEGRTLFRDAFRLLGVKKHATFDELGRKLLAT